jgi:hypothetical protein
MAISTVKAPETAAPAAAAVKSTRVTATTAVSTSTTAVSTSTTAVSTSTTAVSTAAAAAAMRIGRSGYRERGDEQDC